MGHIRRYGFEMQLRASIWTQRWDRRTSGASAATESTFISSMMVRNDEEIVSASIYNPIKWSCGGKWSILFRWYPGRDE